MNYCSVVRCDKKVHGRGLCSTHYARWRHSGDPNFIKKDFHGLRRTTEYTSYRHMIGRCYSRTNPKYSDYGGRGIKVCRRWLGKLGFRNFYADMGKKPGASYTLDRIDNGKGYTPKNCRWASKRQQNLNRRTRAKHPNIAEFGKTKKRWRVMIKRDGAILIQQYFRSLEEAILVRDAVLLEHYKE